MASSYFDVEFKFYYNNMSVTLPVTSEELEITKVATVETADNLFGETKSKAISTGLRRFSISSFFPELIRRYWYASKTDPFYYNNAGVLSKNMGRAAPKVYIKDYIEFFYTVMNEKGTLEVALVGLDGINSLKAHIEDFSHKYVPGTDDVYYTLSLIEADPFITTSVIKKPVATTPPVTTPSTNTTNICIGDTVNVSGNYYYDSYGAKPTYTFKSGFVGKVHIIKTDSRPYPIHITNTSGRWYGWVKRNQITKVVK